MFQVLISEDETHVTVRNLSSRHSDAYVSYPKPENTVEGMAKDFRKIPGVQVTVSTDSSQRYALDHRARVCAVSDDDDEAANHDDPREPNTGPIYYAACITGDGTRRVVWGLGSAYTLDEAIVIAQDDSQTWLDEADDPENATFEYVQIDETRYFAVIAGDVSAEGL